MDAVVYNIGNVAIYGFGLLVVLSFLWGSFVFYKKGVESHFEESHLLDTVVLSGFWAFVVGRLVYMLTNMSIFWRHLPRVLFFADYPGWDRWGVLIGVFLGVFLTTRRTKNKIFDWLDISSLGVLASESIFTAGLAVLSQSLLYGLLSVLFLGAFVASWVIEGKYRTFSWYKGNKTAARSGLLFGLSVSVLGLLYLVEIAVGGRLVWLQSLWAVVLFVGGIVLVYIRSGRTVGDDLKFLFKLKNARR